MSTESPSVTTDRRPEFPTTTNLAWAILCVLRETGAARVRDLNDRVVHHLKIDEETASYVSPGRQSPDLNTSLNSARLHLDRAGYVDESARGVWSITEKGSSCRSVDDLSGFTGHYQRQRREANGSSSATVDQPDSDNGDDSGVDEAPIETSVPSESWRESVLEYIHGLTAREFEFFIRELLSEMGMTDLDVTPATGDGGIDVRGKQTTGGGMTLRVRVQCKRYDPSTRVGPDKVQQLIGAMVNADHAILATTAGFTEGARRAAEDATKRVDLWDGIALCDFMAEYGIGVTSVVLHRVDEELFARVKANAAK